MADTRRGNRYNYFVREVVPAWQDTARKKARTLRHRGWSTFMVAGEDLPLPSRMRRGGPDLEDTMKQLLLLATLMLLAGCAPEVGSKAWCEAMDAKAKGDWTANEATDYAKHCLFR